MTKKKKKSRRSRSKNPALDPSLNLKARRDVIDNRYYVKGVKNAQGELVMPPLDEETTSYLNKFNSEYYNADFSAEETLHITLIDAGDVQDIKNQIRELKAKRLKLFNKKADKTTPEDRNLANKYSDEIEKMEHFLNNKFPKRAAEHANNKRNYDLLNYAKRSNKYTLDSWDILREDELKEVSSDFSDVMENIFEDED